MPEHDEAELMPTTETVAPQNNTNDGSMPIGGSPSVDMTTEVVSATNPATKVKRHILRWSMMVLLVVGNVGMASASGYVLTRPKSGPIASIGPKKEAAVSSNTSNKPTPIASDIKTLHYTAKTLNLEFDYPVDWSVSSYGDNKSINISSSKFRYKASSGKITEAQIKFDIVTRDSGDYYGIFGDDNLIAAASEKVVYTNPSSAQRKETYLSFVGGNQVDADSTTVLVTGNFSYKVGQKLSDQNYKSIDPRISLYASACFTKCQALITAPIPLNIWHNDPNFQKAQELIKSFRIN